MKTKKLFWSLLAIVLAAALSVELSSCKKDEPVPELSVDRTNIQLTADGDGDKIITVTAINTTWTASVDGESTWLKVVKSEDGTKATITVTTNTTKDPRSGRIIIASTSDTNLKHEVTVTQAGASIITVSRESVEFEPEGGTETINVTSNFGWNVSGNPSWLTVNPSKNSAPTSGTETETTITLSVSENTSKDARSCTLTIKTTDDKATKQITVTQKKPNSYILVNGRESTSLQFEGAFNGKSGIDFKQDVNTTSNITWEAKDVPSWLHVSPTNGSGSVSMSIYPTSENNSSSDREATIKLTGNGTDATIHVIQKRGLSDVKVTPTNLVALYNQIGWELEASGNVNKFNIICVTEEVFKKKTDKELLADLQSEDPDKYADEYMFFYAYDSYNNDIREKTTYYICTVAYDENDDRGEIVKTKITTPAYANADDDAWVSLNLDYLNQSQGFQFTATKEGYCNTYHLLYGNLPVTKDFNRVAYAFEINYYIKHKKKHWFAKNWDLEIITDYPNTHTFTYQTTSLSTYPLISIWAWGVFQDGKVSSDMTGGNIDSSEEEDAPKRISRHQSPVISKKNMVIRRSVEEQLAKKHRK